MEENSIISGKILWDNNLIKKFTSKQLTIFDALKNNLFFNELSKSEIKQVAKIAYEREFQADEYVFKTGQPGAAMFIILEGEVRIVREDENNTELEITRLKNNDTLGELALLDNSPRSASAIATKQTKMIAIFREDLNDFIHSNPELGAKILRKLAIITGYRLRLTNDLLIQKEEELKHCLEKNNEG
jgi:CRP/FNR family cyclic AMP-dependent transcriptional regulator